MELQKILRRFQMCRLLKGYIATIYFLIHFQYPVYMSETDNHDIVNKTLCSNKTKSSITHNVSIHTCSFTEKFIENREGRYVDIKQLITQYSSICPIKNSCGVKTELTLLYPDELFPNVTGKYFYILF
jgi:hypothetical protein